MSNLKLLKQARLAGGLKVREVGMEASLHPSAISIYEAGRAKPSSQALARWERALASLLCDRIRQTGKALGHFLPKGGRQA